MITSTTALCYGWPIDSDDAVVLPTLVPKYFMHEQGSIRIDYDTFVSRSKTRIGNKYRTRKDFGYLRAITFRARCVNLESLNWFEYYLRSSRTYYLFPNWSAYVSIVSQTTSSVVVDTLEEDIAPEDILLLLRKDYTHYSIRTVLGQTTSGINSSINTISLSDPNSVSSLLAPVQSFSEGDFLVPMIVGVLKTPPQIKYSYDRETAIIQFSLVEKQLLNQRTIFEQAGTIPAGAILDESEEPILDESGESIVEE